MRMLTKQVANSSGKKEPNANPCSGLGVQRAEGQQKHEWSRSTYKKVELDLRLKAESKQRSS